MAWRSWLNKLKDIIAPAAGFAIGGPAGAALGGALAGATGRGKPKLGSIAKGAAVGALTGGTTAGAIQGAGRGFAEREGIGRLAGLFSGAAKGAATGYQRGAAVDPLSVARKGEMLLDPGSVVREGGDLLFADGSVVRGGGKKLLDPGSVVREGEKLLFNRPVSRAVAGSAGGAARSGLGMSAGATGGSGLGLAAGKQASRFTMPSFASMVPSFNPVASAVEAGGGVGGLRGIGGFAKEYALPLAYGAQGVGSVLESRAQERIAERRLSMEEEELERERQRQENVARILAPYFQQVAGMRYSDFGA